MGNIAFDSLPWQPRRRRVAAIPKKAVGLATKARQRVMDCTCGSFLRRNAEAAGKGAVSLDGRLIDYASIRQAEVLVEMAKQIAA